MIRSELVARIAKQNPHLYAKDVEAVVNAILDRIAVALANDDRVELRDFGAFCLRRSGSRASRNPRTGERVVVPAKARIQFKAGKGMQARLNWKQAEPEPEAEVQRLLKAS